MRRSRKFSNRKREKEMFLYFMCIVALVQIFYLIVRKKYTSLLFFCIVGVLLNLFIKNISIVLVIDILITNILMRTVIRQEGFEQPDTETPKPTSETPAPTTEKPDKKNKLPNSPATVDTPTTDTPVAPVTETPAVESFTNNDKKLQGVNKSIQMLSNLMDKFSSITGQLNYN